MGPQSLSTLPSSPVSGFGTAKRPSMATKSGVPGPGAYKLKNTVGEGLLLCAFFLSVMQLPCIQTQDSGNACQLQGMRPASLNSCCVLPNVVCHRHTSQCEQRVVLHPHYGLAAVLLVNLLNPLGCRYVTLDRGCKMQTPVMSDNLLYDEDRRTHLHLQRPGIKYLNLPSCYSKVCWCFTS